MPNNKINILLTGGHATATAYALIQYIKPKERSWEFFWIGPKSHVEGKDVESLENQVFRDLGVKVFTLDAGRIQRKFTIWTIPSLLKIPMGFVHAMFLLKKIKPDVVLSFGGFVGFPVAVIAKTLNIPVIVHEQTSTAGRGNIAASKFANKIAISRQSSSAYFGAKKTVLTGNPVDPEILKVKPKNKLSSPPVLFITGGHTGSFRINENVQKILEKLLKDFEVVHQTGKLDYFKLKTVRANLPISLRKRYKIYQTISSEKWPSALAKADLVLSRAGANTVSQLLVVKRPAVLVPIPFSYLNEQYENARYAKEFGIALIIEEKDLTPDNLLLQLYRLRNKWDEMVRHVANKKSPDADSSQKLYSLVKSLI